MPRACGSVPLLALLTAAYVCGELSHFLIGVTSRDVARDIHYGDMKCYEDNIEDNINNTSSSSSSFQDGSPYIAQNSPKWFNSGY